MFPVNSAFLYRLGHSDMVFVFKGLPYLRLVDGPRWASTAMEWGTSQHDMVRWR